MIRTHWIQDWLPPSLLPIPYFRSKRVSRASRPFHRSSSQLGNPMVWSFPNIQTPLGNGRSHQRSLSLTVNESPSWESEGQWPTQDRLLRTQTSTANQPQNLESQGWVLCTKSLGSFWLLVTEQVSPHLTLVKCLSLNIWKIQNSQSVYSGEHGTPETSNNKAG